MITVQLDMWPQKDMSHMNDKTTTTTHTHTHTHTHTETQRNWEKKWVCDSGYERLWSFKKEKQ